MAALSRCTNLHMPPGLTSILSTVVVRSRGPHHLAIRFGSVHALNTSSRGASNTRVMKISCLPGSMRYSVFAIVVAPFPVLLSVIVFLLLDYFLQVVVQSIEAFVPESPVARGPIGCLFEPGRLQPAWTPLGLPPLGDKTRALQHLEVL